MKFLKLSIFTISIVSLLSACNMSQGDEVAQTNSYQNPIEQRNLLNEGNEFYARESLDLQAVGALLEKANDAEEFEYLINQDRRVNNLDLNQDGYADYIGVSEFESNDNGERGLSLFSRFGPELIQEIATIIFDRGDLNSSGARVLLSGNDQLYGDNFNYEANWVERTLPIITALFNKRDSNYSSPYYFGNYPNDYEPYQIVETPVYRTRINQIYSEPLFIQTNNPTINEIQIRSPYYGRTLVGKNFPKPVKPSKEQLELIKNNPNGSPENIPVRNGWIKNNSSKLEKLPKGNSSDFKKLEKENKENEKNKSRENIGNILKENNKPPKYKKSDNQAFDQPKPNKIEKQNMKAEKKADKLERGNGGGKSNKGDGGKGNKGGGKKN